MPIRATSRILIAGAATGCSTNIGDQAVLIAMVRDLHERIPGAELTVVSSNPPGYLQPFGVSEVPYTDIDQIRVIASQSDLVILGGGSIFYDYWPFDASAILTPRHEGIAFLASIALIAANAQVPLMIYGVGVGPLRTEMGRGLTRMIFEVATCATVRDHDSLDEVKGLGIDLSKVTVCADPAFSLSLNGSVKKPLAARLGRELPRPLIGVALRNWDIAVDPVTWEDEVASALDAFIESEGGSVVFIPFHKTVDWPLTDDIGLAQRICARMKAENRAVLTTEPNVLELLSLFGEFDLVLAMRLHAAIFAVQNNVPAVALSYDPKVSGLMRSLDAGAYQISLEDTDADRTLALLKQAFTDRAALQNSFHDQAEQSRQLAKRNAALAADLLKNKPATVGGVSKGTMDLLESLRVNDLPSPDQTSRGNDSEVTTLNPESVPTSAAQVDATGQPVTERRARVAILTNRLLDWKTFELRFGGGERYCFQLAGLLRRLNLDVDFYQIAEEPFEREALGFRIFGLQRSGSYSEFDYGVCDDFYDISLGYDHVIYLAPNLASGRIRDDALLICHGIWFDHNLYESFFSFRSAEWFEHVERVFKNPARVVSVDTNSINVVRALWPELAENMVHVPNWVDNRSFFPPTAPRPEPLTILFPRRSDRLRGSGMLADLLKAIKCDCKFVWVGTSNPEDDRVVEALAESDSRLTFLDAKFEEMPEFYRRAEICVIPTIASEGTSLACLEAMASGCAIVATFVGGLPELIQSGVNGLLASPDAEEIAKSVNYLLDHPRERLRMQRAALKTAVAFSLEVWEKRWVEVFKQQGWIDAANETWNEPNRLVSIMDQQMLNRIGDAEAANEAIERLDSSAVRASHQSPSKIAEQFEAALFEREREIQLLEANLADSHRVIDQHEESIRLRNELDAARKEDVSWLRREYEFIRSMVHRVVSSSEESARALREDSARNALAHDVARRTEIRALEQRAIRQEQTIETLNRAVEGLVLREEVRSRESNRVSSERLSELEAAVSFKTSQANEQERIIRARDEAIVWLRGEVENYQRVSQGLASANRILNEELAEKDAHLQVLREAVQSVELELLGLKISRGWKALDQFRKVRRVFRSLTGRPLPEAPESGRPAMLVDRREIEWHSNLQPLLEEVRSRLAGMTALPAMSPVVGPSTPKTPHSSLRLLPTPQLAELRMMLDEEPVPQQRGLPDVICFSVIDWEFRYQRPQQIVSQFAAHGHRVFYISTTRFTPVGSAPRVSVKSIKDNVYEIQLCSVHQPDVYGELIGGVNETELVASLEELRRQYAIDEAISYVMIASWTDLALMTQARWGWRVIYDCMDEWDRFPGIRPAIVEGEKHLVESCDLLVVSSACLSEKWSLHADKLRLARNAVDYDFYAARFGPSHLLADVQHPIIGYFGAIADWFDLELLAHAASARPNYVFVLLGGIFGVDVAELLDKPNVKILGQHPYELMPKYLYQFDVCMIPFKINPITEATDPVKLYEYLSSGKPVVSVNLPELAPYRDYVYVAKDQDEFVSLLDRAVAEDDPGMMSRRRELAKVNDWSNRYDTIMTGLSARTRRVSIAVITYNNLELTKLCLESIILNTDYPNYEVIVVDNNSSDGTRAYLQFMADRFPHVRVVLNTENAGFARANNQAIRLSDGDDIVLLNNDTIVPRGWLSRLVRHLRHDEVGLVGPVSNFVGNEARVEVSYNTWEEMEAFARDHIARNDGKAADIQMLAMFCVAMRRTVFDEIGPLDEDFGLGMFEDDDYAHRARLRGYRVICAADVFVHHVGQASFKKLIETGEYDALFSKNLKTFESKWNVKWSPRTNIPLEFKADYVVKTPPVFVVEPSKDISSAVSAD